MENNPGNCAAEAEFPDHGEVEHGAAGGPAPGRDPIPPDAPGRGNQGLLATIERLQAVLEDETAALQNQTTPQLTGFIAKKNQALWDLSRALRDHRQAADDREIVARISDLNHTLAINRFVLRRHLSAAQEISEILTNAVRAAESDGTYTMDGRLLVPVR